MAPYLETVKVGLIDVADIFLNFGSLLLMFRLLTLASILLLLLRQPKASLACSVSYQVFMLEIYTTV